MVVTILCFGHKHEKTTWFIYEVLEALIFCAYAHFTNAQVTNKNILGWFFAVAFQVLSI